MTWSESGYTSEQTDKPQNKLEGQSDKVYNTTDFLSKFEGNQNTIVSACMQEIQSDTQLKEGFDNLLKSGISNDLINKIKQELKDNAELDEETLKFMVQSIIAESVENFKIGSIAFEGTLSQTVQKEEKAVKEEENAVKEEENAVKEEENAVQEEENAVKEEENAVKDKELEVRKKVEVQNNKEKIERAMEIAKVAREQLLADRPDVDKTTREKAELAKQQLPEETKNQLKEKGYDESFINDYILLRVTLNEVRNDSSFDKNAVAQFEKGVNELSTLDVILKSIDNACNIPDTSLSSFSAENIAQTRTELFNKDSGVGNESLKKAKETNLGSRNYSEIFPEEIKKEDLIKNYGNFLQGQIKQFLENYVNNTGDLKNKIEEIKNNENPTEEEKKILEFYYYMLDELEKKRKETEEQTKNLMEEMCIISQIKGRYMCIGQEEGKDFNLNKAKEIESKDGVLTLKGHIDGVDFSVSHDTIKPNQHLKIKSKLGVDAGDKNTFEIGKDESYVDSPFILPGQDEIFKVISEVVKSNDVSKSSDLSKYLESLQNNIVGRMDEVYKDAELAHHYVTNKVKGEKIVDNSLALIQGIKPNMQDLTKPINQSSNPKLYSFMKMIKFNVENSTTEEKNKLNKCLSKIPEIVDAYKTTKGVQNFVELKYPLIIENFLKNQIWLENGNEDARLGLVFDMLSYYNQNSKDTRANVESSDGAPSKMIIEDLYRDLFEFQSSQSLIATTRKNEETEKQDKEEADVSLHLEDDSIWPPVESPVEYA